MSENPATTSNATEPKRRKLRSCMTCRKQKARCEFTTSTERCHRCGVLDIPCVFDADAHANLLASSTSSGRNVSQPRTNVTVSSSSEPGVEDRLLVIEEALRLLLKATNLPSLEDISQSIGILKQVHAQKIAKASSDKAQSSLGASPNSNQGASQPSELVVAQTDDYHRRLYPTPLEYGLINEDQTTELTVLFEMRYNHCVYAPIFRARSTANAGPFAFTVMVALALRLRTTVPAQTMVRHQTIQLVHNHLSIAMGARPYTIDAIHGLLLIALWSSVLTLDPQNGAATIVPDGWLLLATAVQMAQNLKLDQAGPMLDKLRAQGKEGSPEYEETMEKSKVWFALVTYDLAMSLGSTRPRLIPDMDLNENQVLVQSLSTSSTDRCLTYHMGAADLGHKMYQLQHPTSIHQAASYVRKVDALIQSSDALGNKASDLSLEYLDNPAACLEYRVFRIYQQYSGCVCLSHACGKLAALDESMGGNAEIFDIGTQVLAWINKICEMSESVINDAFPDSANDATFLTTAPDQLFTAIAFCGATLIQSQVTALQYSPVEFERAEEYDRTVEKAIERLTKLALPDSELPIRYAKGLTTMVQKWKIQKAEAYKQRVTLTTQLMESPPTNQYYQQSEQVPASYASNSAYNNNTTYNYGTYDTNQGYFTGDWAVPSIREAGTFLEPSAWLGETYQYDYGVAEAQYAT